MARCIFVVKGAHQEFIDGMRQEVLQRHHHSHMFLCLRQEDPQNHAHRVRACSGLEVGVHGEAPDRIADQSSAFAQVL